MSPTFSQAPNANQWYVNKLSLPHLCRIKSPNMGNGYIKPAFSEAPNAQH